MNEYKNNNVQILLLIENPSNIIRKINNIFNQRNHSTILFLENKEIVQ